MVVVGIRPQAPPFNLQSVSELKQRLVDIITENKSIWTSDIIDKMSGCGIMPWTILTLLDELKKEGRVK